MKHSLLLLSCVFSIGFLQAQKIDSLFFNLYTDSLKKGSWNYINVDAKMSDGRYLPLTTDQLQFKVSNGKLQGNSVWIDWTFPDDSVVVEVVLKKDFSVKRTITIWIKKKDEQMNAILNDSLLRQINDRPKTPTKRKKN
ncbi:hypothetical protein [Lacibacter sp. H407]|uniref:hypothetical protein n=1 Tax=Lacibacter sp. H407 TaxID=3133423 RepID=UPI0030C10879